MNNIEIKNINKLEQYIPDICSKYKQLLCEYHENQNVVINEKQAVVFKNGREWILTSRYDDDYACDVWAEQFDCVNSNAVVVIVGLGNGLYIQKAINKLHKDVSIIIYEPDVDIFIEAMKNIDLTEIMERCKMIIQSINDSYIASIISSSVTYSIIDYTSLYILPNYWNICEDSIKKFKQIIMDVISSEQIDRNTYVTFGKEFYQNILNNLWMVLSNSSIAELRSSIVNDRQYKRNTPVVVVSAGPSLNKNIIHLKKYRKKVFIIACDSALNPLLHNDIIPDIAVSIDSHKPLSNFMDYRVKKIPFVLSSTCIEWFQNEHNGKKFFFADSYQLLKLFNGFNKEFGILDSGGSVANDAFSLADFLGFTNVILIGQDLSYSNGLYYANGIVKGQKKENINEEFIEVEGYYGDKVLTKYNLDSYRKWFEQQIVNKENLNVINSTEGGAMIHGAKNMPLVDACEKYCNDDIDYLNTINNAKNAFTEAELKEVRNNILHYDDIIINLKKSIDSNLRDFYKMQGLISKNKMSNEIVRIYKRIIERIEKMDNEYILGFAAFNNKVEEYEIIDGVNEDTGSDIDDLKNAIAKGIQLQKSYLKNLNELSVKLPELYKKVQNS